MATCPVCTSTLKTVRQREGIYYSCEQCGGRVVTIPQIRRVAGDRFVTGLLRAINSNSNFGNLGCPFCNQKMRRFVSQDSPLELDACKTCAAVWFDPGEFETVPEGAIESPYEARMRATEALGQHRLDQMKQRGITTDEVDVDWKLIPAMFGFPVESDVNPLSKRPWVTWSMAALILLISLFAFTNLKSAVGYFGFVPSEAWRYGGFTLISSFFLHAGIFHLVGNLYFLLIFGDNVEDYIGRWRFVLLILVATLTGDAVHLLTQHSSTTPCIGASGGISGIIVFYALRFPHARLGFLFRFFLYFRWVQIPAWSALALWLLMQFITAILQFSGASDVAATAHLGGGLAGLALWWRWRNRQTESST